MTKLTKITPEGFDVANVFLECGDVRQTAARLNIPQHEVVQIIQSPEVKRYLDGVYLDQGYRNRDKLGKLMDTLIEKKLEEAEESEMYTDKDLAELIQIAHKMRMDEIKLQKDNVTTAVQINNQFGDSNYGRLMQDLIG